MTSMPSGSDDFSRRLGTDGQSIAKNSRSEDWNDQRRLYVFPEVDPTGDPDLLQAPLSRGKPDRELMPVFITFFMSVSPFSS